MRFPSPLMSYELLASIFKNVRTVAGYTMIACGPYYRCKYKYGVMEDDGTISFWRFMTDIESAQFTNFKLMSAPV